MAGDALIELRGVNKHYGKLHVLQDIDLTVGRGEVVVVIGPSGSGKSTLCRTINRLEPIGSGTITLDGHPLPEEGRELARLRAEVGMVFQSFNLFAHKSVLANVMLAPVKVRGRKKEDAERRARQLLERVGLAAHADKYPAQLSGGQQQRVAIARALAMRPQVLLLDEVTSALDPELVAGVLDVLRDIAHTTDITMLIVTHEMNFARDISDCVMMFDQGRVIEFGTPEKIFSEPENDRTREFLSAVL